MTTWDAQREDDPRIPNSEDMYRRVIGDFVLRRQDSGSKVLSSQAFSDPYGEVSVDRSSLISPEGCLALGDVRHLGVVAVTAGQARQLQQIVVWDPIPENRAHALICGKRQETGSARKRIAKKLAKTARWVYPEDRNPFT